MDGERMTTPRPMSEIQQQETAPKLRELAEAANACKVPWYSDTGKRRACIGNHSADLPYIAACSPDAILALLTRAETAEASELAWRLAAARVSLAIAGTDVSTPAAFEAAQAKAATDLLAERDEARSSLAKAEAVSATVLWIEDTKADVRWVAHERNWWCCMGVAVLARHPDWLTAVQSGQSAFTTETVPYQRHLRAMQCDRQ